MPRKPVDFVQLGFTAEQSTWLNHLDVIGDETFSGTNAWDSNTLTDEVVPQLLRNLRRVGLSLNWLQQAMTAIGYSRGAVLRLDNWWAAM